MTEHWGNTLTFTPELLEPVSLSQSGKYITNSNYVCQPKFDGRRLAVYSDLRWTIGFNRRGERIPVPTHIQDLVRAIPCTSIFLDGEDEAGEYRVFDMLGINALDLRSKYLEARRKHMLTIAPLVRLAPTAVTEEEKLAMVTAAIEHNSEGVVFKHDLKAYMPGRAGTNVKLKLWKSATLRVGPKPASKATDDHLSFGVEALKFYGKSNPGGVWVNVGTVGTKGAPIPETGTFVEIRYLCWTKGGRLYQPEDLGQRDDVDAQDCSIAQLVLKGEPWKGDEVRVGDRRESHLVDE